MFYSVVGSRIYVQSALGSDITVNSMNNAAQPLVTTAAAHGMVDNDEFLFKTHEWEELNGTVVRVDQQSTTTFLAKGFDGTNTEFYPTAASSGVGNKITSWIQIGQVLGANGNGGRARKITAQPFDKRRPVKKTVGFEDSQLTLEIGFDPALSAQVELLAASQALGSRAIKFLLPGSAYAYCYGQIALNPIPSFSTDSFMTRSCEIDIEGLWTFVGP